MDKARIEPGSFRDRHGRVFYRDGAVYRNLSAKALSDWKLLSASKFFRDFVGRGKLIETELCSEGSVPEQGSYAATLRHRRIPFVSYPYEWSFSMLKDAALLQLELVLAALDEDIILKDASSFNIQWQGARPVFIDIPSFERLEPGEPWAGYRQFCQLYLYPLFLQAYRRIHFQPWLRGSIDGFDPEQFSRLMSLRDRLRPGVFGHVYLQGKLQARYGDARRNVRSELRSAGFNKELIRSNVRGLLKIVSRLAWASGKSTWSDYAEFNTYSEPDRDAKTAFVRDAAADLKPGLAWDLGSNTGVYSRVASEHAGYVISMDADHLAVERLYRQLRTEKAQKILPLVNNLADPSPNLGWRGLERKSLVQRGRPDLVLCLALIHHMAIGANVPVEEFVDWLSEIGGSLVIEFVTKQDPMVEKLLQNKDDQYADYRMDFFESCLERRYKIQQRLELASGTRFLYLASPGTGN